MQGSHKSGPERMCLCAVCFHMRVGFSVYAFAAESTGCLLVQCQTCPSVTSLAAL